MFALVEKYKNLATLNTDKNINYEFEIRFHKQHETILQTQFVNTVKMFNEKKFPMKHETTQDYLFPNNLVISYRLNEQKQIDKYPKHATMKTKLDMFIPESNDYRAVLSQEQRSANDTLSSSLTGFSLVREKTRVSFINEGFRYDFSKVKSGADLKSLTTTTYEIEMEIINCNLCYGKLIANIEELLCLVYNQRQKFINFEFLNYADIPHGVSSALNIFKPMISKPESVLSNDLIQGYAVTDKPDGLHVLLFDINKTIYIILIPNIRIIKTTMVLEQDMACALEAEFVPFLNMILVFDVLCFQNKLTNDMNLFDRLALIQHTILKCFPHEWNICLKQFYNDARGMAVLTQNNLWYQNEGFVFVPLKHIGSGKIYKYKAYESIDFKIMKIDKLLWTLGVLKVPDDNSYTTDLQIWLNQPHQMSTLDDGYVYKFSVNDIVEIGVSVVDNEIKYVPKRLRNDKKNPNTLQTAEKIFKCITEKLRAQQQRRVLSDRLKMYHMMPIKRELFYYINRVMYQTQCIPKTCLMTTFDNDTFFSSEFPDAQFCDISIFHVNNFDYDAQIDVPCIVTCFQTTDILTMIRQFMKYAGKYLCNGGYLILIDKEASEWAKIRTVFRTSGFEEDPAMLGLGRDSTMFIKNLIENHDVFVSVFRRIRGNSDIEQQRMSSIQK